MTSLALAVIFLLVTHFSASTPVRPAFVARFGEQAWLGLYSLVSLVAFGWMIAAWASAPTVWWGTPRPWSVALAHAVMPVAVFLVVASVTTPNPALAMQESLLDRDRVVVGVLAITRHPMLWGFGLWAAVHGLANPDIASAWLFGGMLVLSLGGTLAQDRKKRRDLGERWNAYARATSNVPFAALLTGRQSFPRDLRLVGQLGVALVLHGVLLVAHPWFAGVPVY